MSASDDPTPRGHGAPTPGAVPEPGVTTGLSAGGQSEAEQRSTRRRSQGQRASGNMLPERARRRFGLERVFARMVATGGVIGIGAALGAILAAADVQGWIIGLAVAAVSVVLSAMLWSSRQL